MYSYLLIVFALIVVLYLYLRYYYKHWERLNIAGPKLDEMIFGKMRDAIVSNKNIAHVLYKNYEDYKEHDLVGIYKYLSPAVLIRNPEYVNKVLVQDFDHFQANGFHVGRHDEITSRNPLIVNGPMWRKARDEIAPAFSSGKLKDMVPLTLKASNNMIDYIRDNLALSYEEGFNARDLCKKYVTDNVASCAFGLEVNCFDGQANTFRKMVENVFDINIYAVRTLTYFSKLSNWLKQKLVGQRGKYYFRGIVESTVKRRKTSSVRRNDFIDVMMQLKETDNIDMVLANSVQIITNGTETTSTTMTFLMYLLAVNLNVQEWVREEIDAVLKKHNDEMTYEAINDMEYMDQVINETLRIYPAIQVIQRKCTIAYTFPKTNSMPALTVNLGTNIYVAVRALHMDEQYFPNPETFEPKRFSPENIDKVPKHVFLPFGDGPRICLGQRFAMIQMKVGLARLLKDFDLRLNNDTIEPVELNSASVFTKPLNPIIVNFYKRNYKYKTSYYPR